MGWEFSEEVPQSAEDNQYFWLDELQENHEKQ